MEHVLLSDIPTDIDVKGYLSKYIHDGIFELTFHYDSDFKSTPRMRIFMDALFELYDIELKDRNRLVLVSDELNNNAVEHGTGDCGENELQVIIHKKSDQLQINIEVTDCGDGNAQMMEEIKKKKMSVGFDKYNGIRGRGLFLITEKIVDRLYFKDAENGGLVVGIEKTI